MSCFALKHVKYVDVYFGFFVISLFLQVVSENCSPGNKKIPGWALRCLVFSNFLAWYSSHMTHFRVGQNFISSGAVNNAVSDKGWLFAPDRPSDGQIHFIEFAEGLKTAWWHNTYSWWAHSNCTTENFSTAVRLTGVKVAEVPLQEPTLSFVCLLGFFWRFCLFECSRFFFWGGLSLKSHVFSTLRTTKTERYSCQL